MEVEYVYAICSIIGSAVLLVALHWSTTICSSARKKPSPIMKGKDGYPERTFSSSVLVVPGKATVIEYDPQAGSLSGTRPVAHVTISQEFHSAHAHERHRNHSLGPENSPNNPCSVGFATPLPAESSGATGVTNIKTGHRHSTFREGSCEPHTPVSPPPSEEPSNLPDTRDSLSSVSQPVRIHSPHYRPPTASSECDHSSSTTRSRASTPAPDSLPYVASTPPSDLATLGRVVEDDNVEPMPAPAPEEGNILSPGAHIYIRRVVRNTAFFQFADKVDGLVEVPSELSNHPELVVGDLFYHRSDMGCQMWVWEKGTAHRLGWRAVGWGYERRTDNKVLILSEKKALPSWVQKSHFLKHTQGHPELQAMVVMPKQ